MRVQILVSTVVLVVLSHNLPILAADSSDVYPFTLTDTGLILVPVTVNGSGPYHFVLDTGSNRSAISDTLAARLSLNPVAVTETVTSSGSLTTPVVRLETLGLGSHHTPHVLTPVLSAERLRSVHPHADGLIGQDVLIDAHYTLDYRRKRLIWLGEDTDSGAGTRLVLHRWEGRMLVELPQSSRRGDVAWFVPDSGASTLVLFRHEGVTTISASALPASVGTRTVTGGGQAQVAMVAKLRVGNDTLWDQPAVLVAAHVAASTDAPRVDGLLPLSAFSSVTFNGRANYLVARR